MGITRRRLLKWMGMAPAAAVAEQTRPRDLTPENIPEPAVVLATDETRGGFSASFHSAMTASSWSGPDTDGYR